MVVVNYIALAFEYVAMVLLVGSRWAPLRDSALVWSSLIAGLWWMSFPIVAVIVALCALWKTSEIVYAMAPPLPWDFRDCTMLIGTFLTSLFWGSVFSGGFYLLGAAISSTPLLFQLLTALES